MIGNIDLEKCAKGLKGGDNRLLDQIKRTKENAKNKLKFVLFTLQ